MVIIMDKVLPYSTYYKPMMYYKPTPLFSSKFLYRYRTLIYGNLHYKAMMYYKPTPLFRADVRKIAHGLIIRTIRYSQTVLACTVYYRVGANVLWTYGPEAVRGAKRVQLGTELCCSCHLIHVCGLVWLWLLGDLNSHPVYMNVTSSQRVRHYMHGLRSR